MFGIRGVAEELPDTRMCPLCLVWKLKGDGSGQVRGLSGGRRWGEVGVQEN